MSWEAGPSLMKSSVQGLTGYSLGVGQTTHLSGAEIPPANSFGCWYNSVTCGCKN